MLVSIIVPFYNVESYFRRCLDSITNQSYKDLEIILVDDCSPDNSLAIAKEYAKKDERITIIEHATSLHVGGARNSGMAVAKGAYIWFIDSDDEIANPYAVEHLVAVAQRDASDVILFRAQGKLADHSKFYLFGNYTYEQEYVFTDKRAFFDIYLDIMLHDRTLYASFSPAVWMKLFRTAFLRQYHFSFLEHTVHQDIATLLLLPLADKITQLPYLFYSYYQREGSTINSKAPSAYIEHFERVARQIWEMYDSYWRPLELPITVIAFLLINHTSYNTRRIKDSMPFAQYQVWLCDLYDFLQKQLLHRINFSQMYPWSTLVANQEQWEVIFRSFPHDLKFTEKLALMHAIFDPHLGAKIQQVKSVQIRLEQIHSKELQRYHVVRDQEKNKQIAIITQIQSSQTHEDDKLKVRQTGMTFKRLVKMFLPYGLIRFIQIYKQKEKK